MGIFRKLIDSEYKELKKFEKIADQIVAKEEEMASLSDEELRSKTDEFKKRLENGETKKKHAGVSGRSFLSPHTYKTTELQQKPLHKEMNKKACYFYANEVQTLTQCWEIQLDTILFNSR